MKITFLEIIDFISTQKDYVVIGSYGLSLHVPNFPYSDDFDVTLDNEIQLNSWLKHFINNGWVEINRNQLKETVLIVTLKKEETILDLILDPTTLKKYNSTEKEVGDKTINVMTAEDMLLRKLSATFRHPERGQKRLWDLQGALELIKVSDPQKILERFKEVIL